MPILRLKTTSGQIADLRCDDIIEIDGLPYQPSDSIAELNQRIAFLEGRVAALFDLFTDQVEEISLPAGAVPENFSLTGE